MLFRNTARMRACPNITEDAFLERKQYAPSAALRPAAGSAKRRRATTLLEVIAAAAVLGTLMIVCAQMLSRTAVQQQTLSNRRAAVHMTANAMERAFALSWSALNQQAADAIAAEVVSQNMLRGAQLDVSIGANDETPERKRIRVTAIWNEGSDGVERKQQLTAWRYAEPLAAETTDEPAKPGTNGGQEP